MSEEIKFKTYGKIKYVGHKDLEHDNLFQDSDEEVYVEEKIDGANARFRIDWEHESGRTPVIVFGSRTQSIGNSLTQVGGSWTKWTEYVKKIVVESGDTAYFHKDLMFYGEAMLKHSIMYDFDKHPPFILYDIYNSFDDKYLDRETVEQIAKMFGFEVAPLLWKGKLKDMPYKSDADIPKSKYYEGQAEGVVIKSTKTNGRMKYVSSKFKEVNKEVFGLSSREARATGDDSDVIITTYFTNARIDKIINKILITENKELDMSLIPDVMRACMSDVIEECGKDILEGNYTWNKREVSGKVCKRAKEIIKQLMVNKSVLKIPTQPL